MLRRAEDDVAASNDPMPAPIHWRRYFTGGSLTIREETGNRETSHPNVRRAISRLSFRYREDLRRTDAGGSLSYRGDIPAFRPLRTRFGARHRECALLRRRSAARGGVSRACP